MKTKMGTSWVWFTAAHRLSWHPKCSRMHGHGFRVRIEVEGEVNSETGIIVDLGDMQKAIRAIVDPLDHHFLAAEDARLGVWLNGCWQDGDDIEVGKVSAGSARAYMIDEEYVLPEKDVVVLPMKQCSTENLAIWILDQLAGEPWAYGRTLIVQVSENGENIAEAKRYVGSMSTAEVHPLWSATVEAPSIWSGQPVSSWTDAKV